MAPETVAARRSSHGGYSRDAPAGTMIDWHFDVQGIRASGTRPSRFPQTEADAAFNPAPAPRVRLSSDLNSWRLNAWALPADSLGHGHPGALAPPRPCGRRRRR